MPPLESVLRILSVHLYGSLATYYGLGIFQDGHEALFSSSIPMYRVRYCPRACMAEVYEFIDIHTLLFMCMSISKSISTFMFISISISISISICICIYICISIYM